MSHHGDLINVTDDEEGCTVEVMLRCSVADRPGALAVLTGVIGKAGGDIQAVEVVETTHSRALDDLVVVVESPATLGDLVERIEELDDVDLVHTGPSRGDPSGAVERLALSFESLLNGAMTVDHAVSAILGGTLRAAAVKLVDAADAPSANAKQLVLPLDDRVVVVTRDYRFTRTEEERGNSLVRAIAEGARARHATAVAS